jgi:hypothetical protein
MLPAGNYIIRNVGTNLSAGRQEAEDKSLNIKQVVLLPQGVEAPVVSSSFFAPLAWV